MAYEYSAPINSVNPLSLLELLDSGPLREHVVLVKTESNELWLNWADTAPRPGSAPDVSIQRDSDRVYIAFHSATAAQREALLHELCEQASSRLQVILAFEEI
jgi:hypothetical protein